MSEQLDSRCSGCHCFPCECDYIENKNSRERGLAEKILTIYAGKKAVLEHPHYIDHVATLLAEHNERQHVRIYSRCPACHNDTLVINKGRLLCTWHECKNPTLIDQLGEPNDAT